MPLKIYLLITFFLLFEGLESSHLSTKSTSMSSYYPPYTAVKFSNSSHFSHQIIQQALRTHVQFLSDASLEGRLTGSIGEKIATQYVANIFHQLGLKPAGDNGTFFQSFNFTAGIALGKRNTLLITNQKGETRRLKLNEEWRPLSFSDSIAFKSATLVFAGYGITAPALGDLPAYDSYKGLKVKDKWVVIFRYMPEKITDEQRRQMNQYASPRYKAFIAKEQGAKGIIFISAPNSNVKNELIPLSADTSLSGSGIIAISIKDNIINELLKKENNPRNSLQTLQYRLDKGQLPVLPSLAGINITGQIDLKQKKQRGRNVLATLMVDDLNAPLIVVGAHIDHLGHGEMSGSRAQENEKGLIHYGADDNASGVASMIESAGKLSALKARGQLHGNKNILFAAWSGEEFGLLGSSHYINTLSKRSKTQSLHATIEANINLDMVGHLSESLVLQGTASSKRWPTLIKQIHATNPISIVTQNDPYLPTDSTSFYLHKIPTLNFFTGSHDAYHTPRDTQDTLNYKGMKNISAFLVDLILAIEDEPNSIKYQEALKKHNRAGRGFRVYLGTIPDYASSDIPGVTLSGVTKDSPAEHAGFLRGDVIIELAGKKIQDIYDYSFVLSALKAGKPVKLIVLRKQKKVVLTVIAQSRD